MNRIYRVVWCHVRNTYVVASELASRKKVKSSKNKISKTGLMVGAAFSALLIASPANAFMSFVDGKVVIDGDKSSEGSNIVVVGKQAIVKGSNAIALGTGAHSEGEGTIAIGAESVATDENTVSFGNKNVNRKLVHVGNGLISSSSKDAVNGSQLWEVEQKLEGLSTANSQSLLILNDVGSQVIYNPNVIDPNKEVGLVLGVGAKSTGYIIQPNDDETFTKKAINNTSSIVLGNKAEAIRERSIAIGDSSKTTIDSVVLGDNAHAIDASDDPMDPDNITDRTYGMTVVGSSSKAKGKEATAIGFRSNAVGTYSSAIGGGSIASGEYATAIGATSKALGHDTVAIGTDSVAQAGRSVVIGSGTQATEYGAVAIGNSASATGKNSIAVGADSVATDENTVSFGHKFIPATVDEYGDTVKEKKELNRRLIHVAEGLISKDSKEAINGSQLHLSNNATVDALGGGSKIDDKGNIKGPTYKFEDETSHSNVGDALENLDKRVLGNNTNITNILAGKAGLIQLSDDGKSLVVDNVLAKEATTFDFSNEGTDRTLSGVEKGKLDNDAVNVSQLKKVTDGLGGDAEVDADGNVTGPTYNITNKEGDNVVHNNVGDALEEIDNSVTNITNKTGQSLSGIEDALGGGAKFDEDGKLTMPNYKDALTADRDLNSVEEGFEYVGEQFDEVKGDITNLDQRVTDNSTSIKNINEGKAGLIQLSDDGKSLVVDNVLAKEATTFDFSNEGTDRTLSGVEKGKLDNDAVNVSQLKKVTDGLGGGAEVDADGNVTGPTYNITNKEGDNVVHNNVGDALEEIDNSVTNITNKTGQSLSGIEDAFGAGAKFDENGKLTTPNYKDALEASRDLNSVEEGFEYVNEKLTGMTTGAAGLIKLSDDRKSLVVDNTLAKEATTFDFSNEGVDRTLSGVEKGKLDNDAVNVSQLKKVTDGLGGGAEVDADGNVTGPTYNITNKEGDNVVHNNVGDALEEIDNSVTNITNKTGQSLSGIEDALGGGAKFDENGKLTMPNYKDALTADRDLNSVEEGFEYVGEQFDEVKGDITNLDQRVTDNSTNIKNINEGKAGLIQLSDDGKSLVVDNGLAKEATVFDFSNEGADRTLSGVEKGKLDNDAVNVSQLKKVTDGLGGGAEVDADGNVTGPTYNITNKEGDNVVHNNVGDALEEIDNSVTNITNKTGQSLSGIEDALGGGAKFDENGKLTMPNYKDALTADRDLNSVEEGFEYVGEQFDEVKGDITNLDQRVTDNSTKIENVTNGKAGLVKLSDDGFTVVIDNELAKKAQTFNIGNEDGVTRVLTGVRAGEISHDSTDAVNGGQIHYFAETAAKHLGGGAETVTTKDGKYIITDPNFAGAFGLEGEGAPIINNVYKGFEYINDEIGKFEAGEAGLLQMKDGKLVFSDVAKKATEFDVSGENGAMKVTNVAAGKVSEDSLEAINGSQLYATNKSIADSLGGGAEVNDDGSIKGPNYVINGNSYNNVGDAITNIDGRVIDNTKNITNLTENINNIATGKAGLLQIDGDKIIFDSSIAGGRTFDISNGGQARKMTGVADGTIAADSKDAVNGGQLHETNQNVAANTDNIGKTVDALGGGAGFDKDGNYQGPNYTFTDGSNHTNVGSALDNLDGRVTDLDKKVDGIANGTEGLVKLETDKDGNQKLVIDNNLASKADTFDIANGEDGRTLTGVADGKIAADSKDAINGSQLHASNITISNIFGGGATVDKNGFVSMPEYDFGDKNVFDNVGDSLAHLNNKIKNGEGGLFQMSADGKTVVLGDTAKTATSVDMGNRVIAGVANGKVEKGSLEAVNGGQLWETNQNVASNTNQIKHINNTLNHYNTRLNNIEKTVHENRKRASAGTASAMAMSSIPYLDYAKYSFGMGVASYDGEAAMSMGLEFRMGDNGRFRIQGSYDTQNKAGVGVGMAFEL